MKKFLEFIDTLLTAFSNIITIAAGIVLALVVLGLMG